MRIQNVPTVIVLSAFFHFKSSEGAQHGFADGSGSFIDFHEDALACEKCAEILERIDEARRVDSI